MFVWVFIALCQCLLFNECLLSFYLVVILLLLKNDMCYNLVRIFFSIQLGYLLCLDYIIFISYFKTLEFSFITGMGLYLAD